LAANEKKGQVAGAEKEKAVSKPRRGSDTQVGQALRSVWDETLGEQVPPDMLDLLGKLS